MSGAVLEVEGLVRHYLLPRDSLFRFPRKVHALNGVSLRIARGRSLGIVGESGCGKSTLARGVMALERPDAGGVHLLGRDLHAMATEELRRYRRHFQMVFQDPFGSLNPRMKVARIVAEPLDAIGEAAAAEQRDRVVDTLRAVGLRPADLEKYPHEFSGGQRQRIAIARALVTRPDLIVADEPVSALDVSVQAQVLNLLRDLQTQFGVTFMLISHDLGVIEYVCDEVAVMYLGRIVEQGPVGQVFARAAHPYTLALLDAVPRPQPGRRKRRKLEGTVGTAVELPAGCAFADRCPRAEARCRAERPALRPIAGPAHHAACHFAEEFAA